MQGKTKDVRNFLLEIEMLGQDKSAVLEIYKTLNGARKVNTDLLFTVFQCIKTRGDKMMLIIGLGIKREMFLYTYVTNLCHSNLVCQAERGHSRGILGELNTVL